MQKVSGNEFFYEKLVENINSQIVLWLIFQIGSGIIITLLYFSFGGILFHDMKSLSAFRTSFLIAAKNLWFVIGFFLVFVFILVWYSSLLILIALLYLFVADIPSLAVENIQTIRAIFQMPIFVFPYRIFGLIIEIWYTVVLIVSFYKFTQVRHHPIMKKV